MLPRALLKEALSKVAVPSFSALGFEFHPRRLEFSRSRGQFTDKVGFLVDTRSEIDTCQFTTHWSVESAAFVVEHQRVWGAPPDSARIAGSQDWLLQGWPRSSLGFRLLNTPDRIAHEMRELVEGAKLVGIPYLERISSYEIAAESWLESGSRIDLACALLLLAGKSERARRAIDAVRAETEGRNLSGKAVALAHLRDTYAMYFKESAL